MKNKLVAIITMLMLSIGLTAPCSALSEDQSAAIQALVDEACLTSGVPGISVSVVCEDEAFFFSSGYSNREEGLPACEDTLYELASVSKAFTGAGILLMEEQGLISMDDPVGKYLPWLTFRYKNESIDMSKATLNTFLYHTSGLTNRKHFVSIPEGNTPDMLLKTIEALVDSELAFLPGERYEYGTVNYDVLAMVIECVSGQRFEDYMCEQVFEPLGLYNTYLYLDEARATGNMAQGYRTSFLVTTPYDAPEYGGNKAAGYVISSTRDMARWMGIHLGTITDIPEVFHRITAKAKMGNKSVPAENEMFYAAGWQVNDGLTIVRHTGSNPNFKSNVVLLPEKQIGICLLSNGSNININMLEQIKDILDGNPSQPYQLSSMQFNDIIYSFAAVIAGLLAIVFLFLGIRRKKQNVKISITKKRLVLFAFWLIVTVVVGILSCVFPYLIGVSWPYMVIWMPISLPVMLIVLLLLGTSVTWFVYTGR